MSTQSLARRFQAIGIRPEEYMPLVRLIDRWARNSDEEWTVQRLKDLRQLYLHRYVGLPYTCETRIALSSDGVPKGPFRRLFMMKGSRAFPKAWNALMVYTGFVAAKVTPKQAKKFLAGVRREEPKAEALRSAMDYVSLGLVTKTHRLPKPPPPKGEDLLDFVPREGKERHSLDWVRVSEYRSILYEAEKLLDQVGAFSGLPDVFAGTFSSVWRTRDAFNLRHWEGKAPKPVIGHVSAVQEPGYKARFIASPYPCVQQMVRPLHQWLAQVNRELQGNWQYDQSAALGWVRDALRTYGYCASVDLSGATDHFPLKLQILALRILGADEQWVRAVETLSTAMWQTGSLQAVFTQVEQTKNPLYWISWTVGQPLGLIFSFNLFTLGHWALCSGIQMSVHGDIEQPLFGLVGDDVVWFSPPCAKRYMDLLEDLGCPYSVAKTLETSRAAEFLSRIVEPERITPSYKWKAPSDDSFIDIARCLGPRSLRLFRPRQRIVLRAIAELPEPYGLGWNPQGIPYWDRLAKVPEEPVTLREFRPVSASHHRARLFYTEERLHGYLKDLNMSYQARDDQSLDQVLTRVFGRVGYSQVLRDSLVRDFLGLSSLLEDEYRKFGKLRPEAIKLLPTELCNTLGVGVKPESAQAAEAANLIRMFQRAAKVYAESPERSTTLERYERSLLQASLAARGRELSNKKSPTGDIED